MHLRFNSMLMYSGMCRAQVAAFLVSYGSVYILRYYWSSIVPELLQLFYYLIFSFFLFYYKLVWAEWNKAAPYMQPMGLQGDTHALESACTKYLYKLSDNKEQIAASCHLVPLKCCIWLILNSQQLDFGINDQNVLTRPEFINTNIAQEKV